MILLDYKLISVKMELEITTFALISHWLGLL